jgi:hypothetical protein
MTTNLRVACKEACDLFNDGKYEALAKTLFVLSTVASRSQDSYTPTTYQPPARPHFGQ